MNALGRQRRGTFKLCVVILLIALSNAACSGQSDGSSSGEGSEREPDAGTIDDDCGSLPEGFGRCTGGRSAEVCEGGALVAYECPPGSVCDTDSEGLGCFCDDRADGLCPDPVCVDDPDCDEAGEPVKKRVFVTAGQWDGNLAAAGAETDGISAADKLCQEEAEIAQLGGTWMAWISTGTSNAFDRLPNSVSWYLVDGATRVTSSKLALLNSGPEAPININQFWLDITESPFTVWTGTDQLGRWRDGWSCGADWNTGDDTGTSGRLQTSDRLDWTMENQLTPCGVKARLYCFEK